MAVGAAVRILWTWLVLREDLLAAIRLLSFWSQDQVWYGTYDFAG